MKKAIVLLLALALIGGTAFAQLTFNGYERGLVSINDGSVTFANRLRMNISANDKDGMFGVGGRIQYDGDTISNRGAFGWVKMADGVIKLTAGKLMVYDYHVGSGLSDYKLGNVFVDRLWWDGRDGFMVQLMPVAGLNVGVMVTPTAVDIGTDNLAVNVKYDIADVGSFIIASELADVLGDSFFAAGFKFTGVEGLAATAAFKYGAARGYKGGPVPEKMSVMGIINYKTGSLTVEVAPDYDLTESDLYVEGYVSYLATEALALRGLFAYDQDAGVATLGAGSTYFGGLEVVLTVGKGSFMTGLWYDEAVSWSVPLMVKVGF